jgi:hypothetical protein
MAKMLKQLGERMLNLTVSAQWLPLRFQEISDSLLINLPNPDFPLSKPATQERD